MERVNFKEFIAIATVAVMLLVLAACASPASPAAGQQAATPAQAANNNAEADAERIEIDFWHNWGVTGPGGQSLEESARNFNDSQSEVYVVPHFVPTEGPTDAIHIRLVTAILSGTQPQIFLSTRGGMAEFIDVIQPLNDLAARDGITRDDFYPWAWDESYYLGVLMGLPYDGTARLLFYNVDHFIEAGLDPENPPRDIATLEEYARLLTIREGNRIVQYGFVPHFAEGSLFTWGLSFGGSFYDIDTGFYTNTDPRIVDALTWMTGFGIDLIGLDEARGFRAAAGADAGDPFISGLLSMKVTGNWRLGDIARFNPDLNFAVTPIPTPTGTDFTTFIGGRALLIPDGNPDHLIEAAWEAIKFMTMDEMGQTPMSIAGNFPASPQFTEQMYRDNEFFMAFADVLPYGYARPVSLASNMFFERFVAAPDLVFAGEDPYEVLNSMDELLNEELERVRRDR